MESTEHPEGVSRRKALKHLGAGAAIVWAVPVISSLTTPASAAGSAKPCDNCDRSYTGAPGCGGGCFCDTRVEGGCVCDVAGFDVGSEGCTSSADCAGTYGAGHVCIHAEGLGAGQTVCIAQCGGAAASPAGAVRDLRNH